MTIDEAIEALTLMRSESALGGGTCLSVCLVDSGVADCAVTGLHLEQESDGSALVIVMVEDHDLREEFLRQLRETRS